jgi:hypothetical protein
LNDTVQEVLHGTRHQPDHRRRPIVDARTG